MRPEGLITLADLPELKGADPKPRSTIVIGRLDDNLRDPRYGKFAITQPEVDGWKRNLETTFGGQVSMDFDHSSDRGSGTRAACWINKIGQKGKLITADVQFTRAGAKAVRDGDYKYTSPTFVPNYTDEHGQKHGPALIGGALTNRPVLRKGMPTLSLSRDSFDGVATVGGSKSERRRARRKVAKLLSAKSDAPRDSRRQMGKLTEIAKTLGLAEDADEATVLAKVTELQAAKPEPAKPEEKPEEKPTATLARDNGDGTMSLSAEGYADLLRKANAGDAAATQLSEQTFKHAWDKAVSEGRAAPAQEADLRQLHKLDPDLAVKTLDGFQPIVPTKPKGSGEGAGGEAPEGMDPERYQLHREATALATRKLEANPKLDEGEAYVLATQELEDAKFATEHPGI